jgi:hypothetical protein
MLPEMLYSLKFLLIVPSLRLMPLNSFHAPPCAAWATFINLLQLQELELGNWLPGWTSHRRWNYVYSPSQDYYWYRPKANSDCTKRKYLLLDKSNAVTGAVHLTTMTLRISPPPRMAALPAIPAPSDLTGYLHSRPDASIVRIVYALQPTHELQAALASGSGIHVLYTGTTDRTYGWTVSADGRPQQKGHSIAYGHSSFRTGAYGLLSALTFLSHYAEFFQVQFPSATSLILASDQRKIANRIIPHRQCTISCHRYFSDANHDIVMELVHRLDSSPNFTASNVPSDHTP